MIKELLALFPQVSTVRFELLPRLTNRSASISFVHPLVLMYDTMFVSCVCELRSLASLSWNFILGRNQVLLCVSHGSTLPLLLSWLSMRRAYIHEVAPRVQRYLNAPLNPIVLSALETLPRETLVFFSFAQKVFDYHSLVQLIADDTHSKTRDLDSYHLKCVVITTGSWCAVFFCRVSVFSCLVSCSLGTIDWATFLTSWMRLSCVCSTKGPQATRGTIHVLVFITNWSLVLLFTGPCVHTLTIREKLCRS
jgi:hypothetical protein